MVYRPDTDWVKAVGRVDSTTCYLRAPKLLLLSQAIQCVFGRRVRVGSTSVDVSPTSAAALSCQERVESVGLLKRNGQVVQRYVTGPEDRPWTSGLGPLPPEWCAPCTSGHLDGKAAGHSEPGWEVDFAAQQFTLPIRFENTLGVSAQLYANLSLIGAALSGMLGGGWLWGLLAWFKARKTTQKKGGRPTRRIN